MTSAETSLTTPAFSATSTSPASTAARYSMPVPTSGASLLMSGTAWRCMLAPIRRSEEHTSELQSRRDLVCRLLLEKKKNKPFHVEEFRAKIERLINSGELEQ